MKFEHVSVLGLAHVDAPEVVTSKQIELELSKTVERLGMPMGLLEHALWCKQTVFGSAPLFI